MRAFYNGTEAAVKRPRIKVTLNPRDLKKFTMEVTTMCKASTPPHLPSYDCSCLQLAQVNHPHCVQIFSASLKASDPFIVMEWMSGGSWFDVLGQDPPPPAYQRIRAARETISALAYLHHALIGIVHGDIKSLNVLRARDGSSKVLTAAVTVLALGP